MEAIVSLPASEYTHGSLESGANRLLGSVPPPLVAVMGGVASGRFCLRTRFGMTIVLFRELNRALLGSSGRGGCSGITMLAGWLGPSRTVNSFACPPEAVVCPLRWVLKCIKLSCKVRREWAWMGK